VFIPRSIWLERNARIFNNRSRSVKTLMDDLVKEAEKWKLVGFL
jgi:hypothetical protein